MKNLKSYREYLEYVYTNEFSIGNMLPQVPLNEKSNTEKPNKVIKNDKGQIVPTVCPKCGSNEKCKRFFGVVPLDKINESVSPVYGAYDAHNKWNAAIDMDGKTYRYRVECLIINGDKVFVSLDKHGNLIIPGGSAEKDIDDITQVANECREEARINIKNPIYTGIDRIQDYPPHISKHKSVLPFEYDGSLSKVYVAEYDSDYNGYIDEYDKDEKMIRGKFVPIKDVVNRLKLEWREALNKYTNVYYRVTYNGEGIYNALKNNIPLNVWIGLLKSDAMRWLPKPLKYNESSRSYFTKEGFKMFMRKTYPVMRKYLNPEFVNIEEVRLPNKMMYSDKYQVVTESSETKYDPPYTYDEIVKNYGKDMADKLVADPAHKFRCHTGIELIHKEPSLSELNRIHSNWQLMTDEQKRRSDMKSRELFGCDNETNYTRLVKTYSEACKDVKNARDSQVEWEKKHGFDPDEDWSKTNINESFETFLTTNPFENTIHLYHASHNQEKLKTINPLSKNFGSRISSMRLSSFWAVDKNVAIIMAIVKLIGMCGYKVQCISGSRFAILNHSESEYDDIMDSLKDKVIWLYEKTMPKKYVKIGHDNVMEEYSIDIPVSPDKSTLYTFNDYKKFVTKDKIVFLTADFLQSKGKMWYNKFINNEMKIIKKENGRFLGNILFKNYDTKGMMNKDFKSLNSNVNESFVDNDLVMENLTDIPNGVNPYSRTKFFHLSMDDKLDGKTLTPRIPSWIKKFMENNKEEFIKNMETVKNGGSTDKIYYYEEYKTPRVCFSSSINGCLNAILMDNGDRLNLVGKCVHVYVPEKPIDQYKHRTNKEIKKSGDIFDANITNEIWILEPVKVKYYGSIIVDSAKECRFLRKTTSDKNKTIAKFNYKWHWYLKERERKENNKNVNESVFMNKDDYYFDFDKFESGESNILFVTGLTGSGKSTIGRSFASKYHAEYVELDLMDPCSNLCSQSLDEIKKDKSNKVIYEYLSSHKSVYERLKSGKMRNDEIFLNNVRFISFVRSYANKHKDTKFIVEGLQLYEYCTFRKTIIKPMVIKGTSVLTSFIRKAKREKWSTKDIIKYAPGTVKRMIKDDRVLLQLINACKTDDVINESVSNITSKSAKGPDDALAKDIRAVIKSLGSDDYKSFDYKSKKMYYQSVYYDGDNPIGFVFTRSFDEEGRHSLTISVALNPDYRGKGLALKMVRDVLNTIKQDKSIYQIYWGADMDNKGSIELAKRAGFKHNYDYRDSTFYTKVVNNTKTVNESVKRSELPDDVFGIPQERKYPMQDKQHVKAAIKFFNYVEPKYEEQLANRIIENMKIYNIDVSSIGDKNRLKKYIIEGSRYDMTHSLVKDLEFLYFESGDPDIPDLIEPIVKQLESKGYQVKYASPGHTNTRFDNDRNKDGVINAKMRSTARIIFSRDYRFKTTPQGWEWKVLENGSKALYVKPYTYNEKMGSKEEAFKKWQTFYIDNMKSWVTDLPKAGSDAKSKPDVNF